MVAQICFEVRGSLAWVDLTTGGRRADGSSKLRCARAQGPHEQSKPDIVYMSDSGRTGRVANGVANAMDERDARCTARSARRPPTAFLHGTARDGSNSMLVAIIIRVGPDGLNTHVDEYFDRVLDPLHKQEPSRR
jgi:hypothetical protein